MIDRKLFAWDVTLANEVGAISEVPFASYWSPEWATSLEIAQAAAAQSSVGGTKMTPIAATLRV